MSIWMDVPESLTITVRRSGGLAGMTRTWSVTVTGEPAVTVWWPLVQSCPWDDAPAQALAPQGGDRFVYLITVAAARMQAGPAEHDARVPEGGLTGPWQELVTRVREESR